MKIKKIISVIALSAILITTTVFSGCLQHNIINRRPIVSIEYPRDGLTVSKLLMVYGKVSDPDGNNTILEIELKIDNGKWIELKNNVSWSYNVDTTLYKDGYHTITVRAFDGKDYSNASVSIFIKNEDTYSNIHKWALFVATANRPDVKIKLGNGGLLLAEKMARYFIHNYNYPPNHITILFDDGWLRSQNGKGKPLTILQERNGRVDGISYGAATIYMVKRAIEDIIEESNQYNDSEVFIWMFNHGVGNEENKLTGGKILEHSEILLWDGVIPDNELGELLSPLKAKMCLIVDACYSGGFADRAIWNLPTILRSHLPANGRIIITGASKFTVGYASTVEGPLFTTLWFEGLKGKADGFRKGLLDRGRPTHLRFFKDGKVSVEEAFYFARYMLTTKEYKDYREIQPQMNDRYPTAPPFNHGEMLLDT